MSRRSYRQNCALARAVDVVGERWTLLIIRELLIGERRYKELAEALPGMGTNLLAERLKQLKTDGLIEKSGQGPTGYALTEKGRDLEPAVLSLIRWGLTLRENDPPDFVHRDRWDVLALKALFDETHQDEPVSVYFREGEAPVWVRVGPGEFDFRFDIQPADVVLEGSLADLYDALKSGRPLGGLVANGGIIDLKRFLGFFTQEFAQSRR